MQMLVIGHLAQMIVLLLVNQQLFFPLGHAKSSSWSCAVVVIDGVKHTAHKERKIFVRLIVTSCATWRWAPDYMWCVSIIMQPQLGHVFCWINSWELTVSTTKVRDMFCDPDAEHRRKGCHIFIEWKSSPLGPLFIPMLCQSLSMETP